MRHPKARGFCSQSERLLYGRDPIGSREDPGKQKPRSCGAQELARSSAQENERRKKGYVPQSVISVRRDKSGAPVEVRNLRGEMSDARDSEGAWIGSEMATLAIFRSGRPEGRNERSCAGSSKRGCPVAIEQREASAWKHDEVSVKTEQAGGTGPAKREAAREGRLPSWVDYCQAAGLCLLASFSFVF